LSTEHTVKSFCAAQAYLGDFRSVSPPPFITVLRCMDGQGGWDLTRRHARWQDGGKGKKKKSGAGKGGGGQERGEEEEDGGGKEKKKKKKKLPETNFMQMIQV
jgi:hypothetical protein